MADWPRNKDNESSTYDSEDITLCGDGRGRRFVDDMIPAADTDDVENIHTLKNTSAPWFLTTGHFSQSS